MVSLTTVSLMTEQPLMTEQSLTTEHVQAAEETARPSVYFDGFSSRAQAASWQVQDDELLIWGPGLETRARLGELSIEPALPRLPRLIRLPAGARLQTLERARVAELEATLGLNRGLGLVARLEAQWGYALASIAAVVATVLVAFVYGVPVVARLAAQATPASFLTRLDQQSVALLDNEYVYDSELPLVRRQRLQAGFAQMAREVGGPFQYRLLIRSAPEIGPNAFALPGGTVVLTDELVKLARSDAELYGVLAHELGHVRQRHSMQGIYRSLGVTLIISVVAGDVGGATTAAAALPAFLINNGYSREMETEADAAGGAYLMRHYGTTIPLQNILSRLSEEDGPDGEEGDLLHSHPGGRKRIAQLRQIEAAWTAKQGR